MVSRLDRACFGLLAALAAARSGTAQTVTVRQGDIYLSGPAGHEEKLTSSGRDSDATLSADKKKVVFVRVIRDRPDASGLGKAVDQSEIDTIDLASPTRETHVLLDSPIHARGLQFQWFSSPGLSPDGRFVYFSVPDYSTVSPGLFELDTTTRTVRPLAPALRYWIVPAGVYRGDLVVWQNPVFVGGGRYDVFNLIKPSGDLVGAVGFNQAQVDAFMAEQSYAAR